MSSAGSDLAALVDAQAKLVGLSLTDEQRAGVLRYMQLVAGIAPRVMEFPLAPADESGNVFRPVEPPGVSTAAPPALAHP
ncbi:MAG: DUF4089 domain-containing protein [Rubrivivax sp.]|nr:DUF4089 domain-containing protein [Rubrivivax sp.]